MRSMACDLANRTTGSLACIDLDQGDEKKQLHRDNARASSF